MGNLIKDDKAQLSVLMGFVIMVVAIGAAIIFAIIFGLVADQMVGKGVEFTSNLNIPEEANTFPNAMQAIAILRLIPYLLSCFGVIVFFISIVKRMRYDESEVYSEEEYME